jgi:poly(3-hydroxybutyrate) depolymerase
VKRWLSTLLCVPLLAATPAGCGEDGIGPSGFRNVEWHQVESSLGTVQVALVRPAEGTTGPHPVVFALPWGGGTWDLALSLVERYWIHEAPARGYYVVSPAVRGTSLAQEAGELIPAIFEWMQQELDFDPEAVLLTGASNGGRGAFFAAISQPQRFAAVLGMPGDYSGPEDHLAVLEGKPIRLMVGELDTSWVASSTATRDALLALGIDVLHDVVPGQDHVLSLSQRELMDWVDEALGR